MDKIENIGSIDSIDSIDKLLLQKNFETCLQGYHNINSCPLKEAMWEEVNIDIFESLGISINNKSNGSHLSGMDIDCSIGKISNKSAKYINNKSNYITISSYRLTSVCDVKECGEPIKIIEEINKRKNFDYYSCILRKDFIKKDIDIIEYKYEWLLIPSSYKVLDPSNYEWNPTYSKKNPTKQTGWETNIIEGSKMNITFSTSSQLWIKIKITEEIKKFIIASVDIKNERKMNYFQLGQMNL
jgi:hypothetical protein